MSRARGVGRTARVRVAVTDGRGQPLTMGRSLGRWLEQHAPRTARGTVAVALVSDVRMRALNRTFRGVDTATDVLSFPAFAIGAGVEGPTFRSARAPAPSPRSEAPSRKPQAPSHLGDLAIATGVAARQARAEGHTLATELRILALHGLLHLLGYDHERDRGNMRTLEDRLRRRAGLPAGLITRAPKRPFHR